MEYGNFSLSEQPETIGIKGWDASYNRITTWAILQEKSNGKKLVFFNTHLDNDGEIARKEGVQLILNKIKEIAPHMPAIITGDFNCTPDETPLQTLEKGGMENASKVAAIKTNRYRVIQDRPENGFLSDHDPVLVDVILQ